MKLSTILRTLDTNANVIIMRNENFVSDVCKCAGNHYAKSWLGAIDYTCIDPDVSSNGVITIDDTYEDYIEYKLIVDISDNYSFKRFSIEANRQAAINAGILL